MAGFGQEVKMDKNLTQESFNHQKTNEDKKKTKKLNYNGAWTGGENGQKSHQGTKFRTLKI